MCRPFICIKRQILDVQNPFFLSSFVCWPRHSSPSAIYRVPWTCLSFVRQPRMKQSHWSYRCNHWWSLLSDTGQWFSLKDTPGVQAVQEHCTVVYFSLAKQSFKHLCISSLFPRLVWLHMIPHCPFLKNISTSRGFWNLGRGEWEMGESHLFSNENAGCSNISAWALLFIVAQRNQDSPWASSSHLSSGSAEFANYSLGSETICKASRGTVKNWNRLRTGLFCQKIDQNLHLSMGDLNDNQLAFFTRKSKTFYQGISD